MGPLCDNVHKKLAGRIAIKRKENYGDVIRFIRTRLRFALLKCVLMGLRGVRGKDFGDTELKTSLLTSALASSLKPRFMRLNL